MPQTMPTNYVRTLLTLVKDQNKHDELLQEAEITLTGPTVTVAEYCRLFERVIRELQTDIHGDEADIVKRFSSYRLVMESMTQADNLHDAISRADTFFRRLGMSKTRTSIEQQGNTVKWILDIHHSGDPETASQRFSMDGIYWLPGIIGHASSLWIWHRIASWLIGSHIQLDKLQLIDEQPEHPKRYNALFNTPVEYGKNTMALYFSNRYLTFPIVKNINDVSVLMENFLQGLFDTSADTGSLSTHIRRLIGNDFTRPLPTTETLAKLLNMSAPTLHRHLQKEDTSYQKIKDDCRHQASLKLLRQTELPIKEIARQMGFSDSGTFHRAFKKWTGMTPSHFRDSGL